MLQKVCYFIINNNNHHLPARPFPLDCLALVFQLLTPCFAIYHGSMRWLNKVSIFLQDFHNHHNNHWYSKPILTALPTNIIIVIVKRYSTHIHIRTLKYSILILIEKGCLRNSISFFLCKSFPRHQFTKWYDSW